MAGGNPLPPLISETSFVCSHGLVPRVESKVWVLKGNRNGIKGGTDRKDIKNEKRVRDIYMTWWTQRVFRSLLYLKKLFSAPSSTASIPFHPYLSLSKNMYISVLLSFSHSVFIPPKFCSILNCCPAQIQRELATL